MNDEPTALPVVELKHAERMPTYYCVCPDCGETHQTPLAFREFTCHCGARFVGRRPTYLRRPEPNFWEDD